MATCCGTAVNEEYGAPPDCGVGVSCCDSSTTNFVDYEAGAKLSCPDMYLRGGCADQDPTIRQQIHTLCPKACGLCVISDDGDDYGGGGGDDDDDSNNQVLGGDGGTGVWLAGVNPSCRADIFNGWYAVAGSTLDDRPYFLKTQIRNDIDDSRGRLCLFTHKNI